MNDAILRLLPQVDASVASRSFDAPLQPVQVPAVGKPEGNDAREAGADNDRKLQERLAKVAERLNGRMQEMQRSLRFSVDDDSGRVVVKVMDKNTDEVIRQIPSEQMLALMKHINDVDGLIFDDRA
ncbi:MAG TPA: flagellar protein FlaG [Gammaproteobacteria bacterium]|nr:flagellar protein FlaG [Gammaproteobacteria bacterium]